MSAGTDEAPLLRALFLANSQRLAPKLRAEAQTLLARTQHRP